MNIDKIIAVIMLLCMMSCSNWLDVEPSDTVTEEQLFAEGSGYRTALHGVYRQMSEWTMYGKEMSWGMVDVMSQQYLASQMSVNSAYRKVMSKYDYEDKYIKPIFEGIWLKSYNSIANCNNLIGRMAKVEDHLFAGGEEEKKLIHGEALALRAYLHFDLLRLFAPAPVADDGKYYIPYFEKYPSTFEPAKPVADVLDLIVRDLQQARELVGSYDTIPAHKKVLQNAYRLVNPGSNSALPSDLFYLYRGYRMNYYAVTALLARVYNYMAGFPSSRQDYHKLAFEAATEVIEARSQEIIFRLSKAGDKSRKLFEGVIFGLSNQYIIDEFKEYTNRNFDPGINLVLADYNQMFDDNADIRSKHLTQKAGSYWACNKYLTPPSSDPVSDLIPMLRLSEMYYIRAEYYAGKAMWQEAKDALDDVRVGRNCTRGRLQINDWESFRTELLKEAKRDFMEEGQLFFYYKKLNVKPNSKMPDEGFVVPLPDCEIIN